MQMAWEGLSEPQFHERRGGKHSGAGARYRGLDRRRQMAVRGPSVVSLVVAAMAIVVGAVSIQLAGRASFDLAGQEWVPVLGNVFDAVALGFALLAALVLRERERMAGDAFSSRFGAVMVVLGLGMLPAELTLATTDSELPRAFVFAAVMVITALLAQLVLAPVVSTQIRLRKSALAGVLTVVVTGLILGVTPRFAQLRAGDGEPVVQAAVFGVALAWLLLAVLFIGTGFRRQDVRYRWVALLLVSLAVSVQVTTVSDDQTALAFITARLVRLIGVSVVLYGLGVELRNVVLHERQSALEIRLRATRATERLIGTIRHQEEVVHDARSALLALEGGLSSIETLDGDAALMDAMRHEVGRLRGTLANDEAASPRPFNIGEVLEPMIVCYQAAGANISFTGDRSVWALGRGADTAEIVQNLIDNALRHAGNSPVVVWVGAGDDTVSVRVGDRGTGIDLERSERLFERGGSGQGSSGGGLGLYTARCLAEAQGGVLSVDRREGGGSLFRLVLRRATQPDGRELGLARAAQEVERETDGVQR